MQGYLPTPGGYQRVVCSRLDPLLELTYFKVVAPAWSTVHSKRVLLKIARGTEPLDGDH
jgi:hypothetical protein